MLLWLDVGHMLCFFFFLSQLLQFAVAVVVAVARDIVDIDNAELKLRYRKWKRQGYLMSGGIFRGVRVVASDAVRYG